ncbi:general vesicular transport factor p115 isoform X2 [Anguilla anguilla]|uniref:general vesicular transport factor p115 isoform X2 n=1 Tax=Anguilla anguilla TaxID=7936 RepID=UPI0015B1A833|nr:general vesicular transport factor p115 isoform X2 [Anguilla anguilla]
MNFLRGVMGGQPAGPQQSGAETIQKLCDRVASSTLLEDRRDAVRALKSLSKKYRLEVGTQAMGHLIHVLQTDSSDSEIIGYALDTLYNVISNDEEEEQEENSQKEAEDLGSQLTDALINEQENITLILRLLEEFDFHVRWPGVKLITALLKKRCGPVQGIILVSPMGVSRLMDLLADSREIIRNDALLLLQQLTKGNAAIQKIVAFENAFERLLDIISEEGSSDGGIVVEDCLLLLLSLLKNNSSNQNFYKEGSYVQRMKPWFEVRDDNSGWSAQKVTNLHRMLQLVRVMVSPVNSPGAISSCQKAMHHCGLLQQLCAILMATGVPADILTETINTVSEVIRGSQDNQDYFASVNAPSNPPRPAIVVLLMSMVNERQPFVLRCAVLYCFQSFLYRNHKGQEEVVSTLLPSTIEASSITAGQLLCGGLFSSDSLSNWCAAVALSHALLDNPAQKEQLLRVQLATSAGTPPISLLQQCTNILSQGDKIERRGSKVQTRVGLLILLCSWISSCPIAVTHFLHNHQNVSYLTGQISENQGEDERLVQGLCALLLGICICYNDNSLENHTKEKLKQLIEKRIGKENFVEKLSFISKQEQYSRAAHQPQPTGPTPEHMLFDHQFTKLVKELEGVVTKSVYKSSEEERKEEEVKKTLEQHDSIMTQYKELIREQDAQINELKEQVVSLSSQSEQMKRTVAQQVLQIQQHRDQHSILKLKLEKGSQQAGGQGEEAQMNGLQREELSRLREELQELRGRSARLEAELADRNAIITSLNSERAQTVNGLENNAETLKELEALRSRVASQSTQISQLQAEKQDLLKTAAQSAKETVDPAGSDLQSLLTAQTQESERLKEEVRRLAESGAGAERQLASANSSVAVLEAERARLQEELTESRKEQDDLLMLLADQDQKITTLRNRLKALGEPIEDEDDLDSQDQGDDDDDEPDDD